MVLLTNQLILELLLLPHPAFPIQHPLRCKKFRQNHSFVQQLQKKQQLRRGSSEMMLHSVKCICCTDDKFGILDIHLMPVV